MYNGFCNVDLYLVNFIFTIQCIYLIIRYSACALLDINGDYV